MTLEQRKLAQVCARCPRPSPDRELCDVCHPRQLEHARESAARWRPILRARGLCVDCRCPSLTYRCHACRPRKGDSDEARA